MFRRSLIAALGVAALATASVAVARPHGPLAGVVRSLEDVSLTEAQSAELDTLLATLPERPRREGRRGMRADGPPTDEAQEARREARRAAHERRRATREAHRAMILAQIGSDEIDAGGLHAMVDGGPRGDAPAEVHAVIDRLVAFHATLTPEQRASWVDALEARMAARAERGHRGRGHGRRMGDPSTGG